jgi:hypothetical protein
VIRLRLVILLLSISTATTAQPVTHRFSVWGVNADEAFKTGLYIGWLSGFFIEKAGRDAVFLSCLETLPYSQAIAMVDKYYKDHPERWSRAFRSEMVSALAIDGGPCEGKNSLPAGSN